MVGTWLLNLVYLDGLTALLEQLNISVPTAAALTVALHEFIQDTVAATVREVTAGATDSIPLVAAVSTPVRDTVAATVCEVTAGATDTLSIPLIAAVPSPMVPAPTLATTTPSASPHSRTYSGTTYDVPAPTALGPYYWVTRGRRIGVFSTW